MKIELEVWGPETAALIARVTPEWQVALEADQDRRDERWNAKYNRMFEDATVEEAVKEVVAEEAKPEPAKKRTRAAKAEEPKPTPEPEPAPAAEVEDAEVVEETLFDEAPAAEARVFTRDDVRGALNLVVQKKGMAEAVTWLKNEFGYQKMSDIPEDAAIFEKIAKAGEAIHNG